MVLLGQIGSMVLKVEFRSNFLLHEAGSSFSKVSLVMTFNRSISESVKKSLLALLSYFP